MMDCCNVKRQAGMGKGRRGVIGVSGALGIWLFGWAFASAPDCTIWMSVFSSRKGC
jgi:hypothetical protein